MFRNRAIIAIVLALALVASACGGGDSTSDDTTTTTTSGGGGTDTTAASTTTTTSEPASGDSDSTYCERVRAAQEGEGGEIDFNLFGKSPEEIEEAFEKNLEVFKDWRDLAPDAVKDDANVLVDAFAAIVDRGNELEWDFNAMADDEIFNSFDDAALTQATDNLDAYSRDVCGVDFTTLGNGQAAPPPGGNGDEDDPIAIALNAFQLPANLFSEDDVECLREELGSEFEASITADWVPTQDDINLILDAVDACEISILP